MYWLTVKNYFLSDVNSFVGGGSSELELKMKFIQTFLFFSFLFLHWHFRVSRETPFNVLALRNSITEQSANWCMETFHWFSLVILLLHTLALLSFHPYFIFRMNLQ